MIRDRDLVRFTPDEIDQFRSVGLDAAGVRTIEDFAAAVAKWCDLLEEVRADVLEKLAQRLAFEEYVQAVEEASARVQRLGQCIEQELTTWRWRSVVAALQACRGIQLIHAVRIVAELGDLSRFGHPRQLMSYLGLIPSENSSGERRRQGAITKAGNAS
jgi:transposase